MGPNVYIVAGPNGAGKTTFAREFLPNYADCRNFINADLIAEGISPFLPEAAAVRAGRLMLEEIRLAMRRGADFGFETTLSGRSHLNLVRQLKTRRYSVHFLYLWVPSVCLRWREFVSAFPAAVTMCLSPSCGGALFGRCATSWLTIVCSQIVGSYLTIPSSRFLLLPSRSKENFGYSKQSDTII